MTTLDWLYMALAILALAAAISVAAVAWQATVLLATLRASLLPQIQVLLTDTQKSLVHVESITKDVEHKLGKLEDTVDDVNITTHSVATTARFFSEGVARPFLLNAAAAVSGAVAAVRKFRELQKDKRKPAIAAKPDAARLGHREEASAL